MICSNCNSLIDDNSVMCPECGAPTTQNSNDNFNNYFAQDGNFSSGYQNPQFSQQNNFNPPFPNGNQDYNQGYNQYPPNNYQYPYSAQPSDPGEKDASTSMILGIISLFLGPILAIISLVFASKYKKTGNGQNAGKVKAGKICSWISIISVLLSIVLFLFTFGVVMQENADMLENLNQHISDEFVTEQENASTNNNFFLPTIPEDDVNNEFGTTSEYNGIYKIAGFSATAYDNKLVSLLISFSGVDNENSGAIDMANYSMEKYIAEFNDYIYIELSFEEGKVKDWNVIEMLTFENLGKPTKEELIKRFKPEESYEIIPAGDVPEEILLSDYATGKTYVFDFKKDSSGYHKMPKIINDTETPVISIATKDEATEDFDDFSKKLCINKIFDGSAVSFSDSDSDKFYLAITESTVDFLLKTEDCFYLSKCLIGEEIDFNFEDYLYNDTNKTFTLSCEETEYILAPGEVAECSWMNDVMVLKAE